MAYLLRYAEDNRGDTVARLGLFFSPSSSVPELAQTFFGYGVAAAGVAPLCEGREGGFAFTVAARTGLGR